MEFALIEDGYSIDTTIPRVAGLYPTVKIRFRPALSEERQDWLMGCERDLNGKERGKRIAALIRRHLEAWDIRNRSGGEVAISELSAAKLHPALQARILDLILGYSPVQEADDEKNSLPASTS